MTKTRYPIVCMKCGATFEVPKYRVPEAKYCSARCRSSATATKHLAHIPKPWAARNGFQKGHTHGKEHAFKPGSVPWNAGVKTGIRKSIETEFKPGVSPRNTLPVGTESVRPDKNGKPRVWVKIGAPNRWVLRAVMVWEAANGPLPKGHLVHHKNRDSVDDSLGNLESMTRAEHAREHIGELHIAKAQARCSRMPVVTGKQQVLFAGGG